MYYMILVILPKLNLKNEYVLIIDYIKQKTSLFYIQKFV